MYTPDETKKRLVELSAGVYVERDVLNIVEKVREYDDNLRIKFCEPSLADTNDPPYKLVEVCKDGMERVVFDIWDLDETVLERIYNADTQRQNILLAIDGKNLLAKKQENSRYEESMAESHDILVSYLKSPKHNWSVKDHETGKTIVLDDRLDTYKVKSDA